MGDIKVNSKGQSPQEQNSDDDNMANAYILKREQARMQLLPITQDMGNQSRPNLTSPVARSEAEELIKNSSIKEGKAKIDDFMSPMLVSDDLFQEDKQELRTELKREKPKKNVSGGEQSDSSSNQNDKSKNNSQLLLEQAEASRQSGSGSSEQKGINDADISGIKENDFSLSLKSKRLELARENKESHKFVNNELTRGMKHYHVLLDKYPESKAAFEKADLFPKLNRELSRVIAPVLDSQSASARALGLGFELPAILKTAHSFPMDNTIDEDIVAPLIKRAASLNVSPSPLVRQFGQDLEESLKGLMSDNIQVKEKSLNALDDLLKSNDKFIKKLKSEDPVISDISKSGPQSSEKLYKQYLEKVDVEKLLRENPQTASEMQAITDNFVRNLHVLGENMTKDVNVINETLFSKPPSDN